MEIKSYKGAVKYLEGFIGKVVFNIDPKSVKLHPPLDRMKMLLSLLSNPQEKFRSVLVGGTSGKGSTAYLISHILTTAGYKTGLTISPHLQKVNERLQINGRQISNAEFTKMVASMIRIIETMKKMPIGVPSYFEILIAMAFLYFAQQKVDIAVVEVGMGGKFDGTNTLYPLIAVLTNVSLDHTSILGKTAQKIARTKAGIIKQDTGQGTRDTKENRLIVISGVKQPAVVKIVEDRRREVGARLYRLGKDFDFKIEKETFRGSVFGTTNLSDRLKKLSNLRLSLLGTYQVENASLAIETVRQLADFGFKVSKASIRKALKTAFFPGRFEVIKINPILRRASLAQVFDSEAQTRGDKISSTLILDGAHNPTKIKAFLTSLKKLYPKERKIFVIGFKFDKDIPKMLLQITKVADKIIVTEFDRKTDMAVRSSADALNIKDQISKIKYDGEVMVEKDSKKAFDLVLNILISQYPNIPAVIVVTGSLYLVGEIRNML